jgi:putative transposase
MKKQILKTFKVQLLPTDPQKILLEKHFGCTRFVYNYFLNERNQNYLKNKEQSDYYGDCLKLTQLKKQEEFKWLKETNAQSLQCSLTNLDLSFNRFFKKKSNFPNFKSKFNRKSFEIPQDIKLENNKLSIPKFREGIKINLHREIEGTIKHCTISKTPTSKYFVSILCETEHEILSQSQKSIGLDLGIKTFVVTSDGQEFENIRTTKKYSVKLKKSQQHLSKKIKGSNRYNKQKLKVARIYEKIVNTRLDNIHKVTTQLIKENQFISVEDLNVKSMIKNKNLSKHISDVSWSKFLEILTYKADWNNRILVKVDRFYPSSKTCNECGYIHKNLSLSERTWTCKNGHVLNRDINAAKNILSEGVRQYSEGTSENTNGETKRCKTKVVSAKLVEV